MNNKTHAQNRFLRRIANRAGDHPAKGAPIEGKLTQVEIEHKARHRARRLAKAKAGSVQLPERLQKLQHSLSRLEAQDKPEDSARREDLNTLIWTTKNKIDKCERELSRLLHILSSLS